MRLTITREKARAILIVTGVLIALALPLMFVMEDFVREAIVQPLAYQAWFVNTILSALPQSLLIGALLALMLYLAIRSLGRRQTTPWKPPPRGRQAPGSVHVWLRRLELVSQGDYSRERFDHHFSQLVMRVLAYDERLPQREMLRRLEIGELPVPPALLDYLRRALRTGFTPRRSRLAWLKALLQRRHRPTVQQVAQEIEPALQFVEVHLRIKPAEEIDESQPFP